MSAKKSAFRISQKPQPFIKPDHPPFLDRFVDAIYVRWLLNFFDISQMGSDLFEDFF
jgi:hypothetical protein